MSLEDLQDRRKDKDHLDRKDHMGHEVRLVLQDRRGQILLQIRLLPTGDRHDH